MGRSSQVTGFYLHADNAALGESSERVVPIGINPGNLNIGHGWKSREPVDLHDDRGEVHPLLIVIEVKRNLRVGVYAGRLIGGILVGEVRRVGDEGRGRCRRDGGG